MLCGAGLSLFPDDVSSLQPWFLLIRLACLLKLLGSTIACGWARLALFEFLVQSPELPRQIRSTIRSPRSGTLAVRLCMEVLTSLWGWMCE